MINRVISGGQTGIDQLGLWVAKQLGIPTGGTAPKGYRTEAGANYLLKVDFMVLPNTHRQLTNLVRESMYSILMVLSC